MVSFLMICFFVNAQNAGDKKVELSSEGKAAFKFKSLTVDFGEIKQGVPKTAEFELSNVGTAPIIINNVQPSCGCTNVEFPKEPVKPGQTVKIKATYNAAAIGSFDKKLTVYMNATPDPQVLTIKGVVKNL